jgi:putative aminopeptidase FrvX
MNQDGPFVEPALVDEAIAKILDLARIPSPTGFAAAATDHVEVVLRAAGLVPTRATKGSIACELGGTGRPLLLAAHVDTLGAMVRAIKPNGRLRYAKVGGYPDLYLVGETCLIHGREGQVWTGTFQPVDASVHVNRKLKELKPDDETMEVLVDEAVSSADETRALGIAPGDFISIDARSTLTASGYLKSRHLDDKASSGILLALAGLAASDGLHLGRRVVLLFTTWEEVGHGGSVIPAGIEEFLAVDMGAVGDDLGCTDRQVSIAAKDSSGPYDRSVVDGLRAAAERAGCSYSIDVYPDYGSDAGAALRAGHDLRHGCVGPGVYASHGYERTHRDAIANTLALLLEYVKG